MTIRVETHNALVARELREILDLIEDEAKLMDLLTVTTNPAKRQAIKRLLTLVRQWRHSYSFDNIMVLV